MGRQETYPWSELKSVGDFFIVEHMYKPYVHVSAVVSNRNSHYRGKLKYSCAATSFGCLVFLVQVGDEMPEYDYEILPGLYGRKSESGPSLSAPEPNLTQKQRVDRMSVEEKQKHLPWWHDPRTGQLLWNSQVAKQEDTDAWVEKRFNPGPNDPYPEHYHLDENLHRMTQAQIMSLGDDEEDEDWGDPPILGDQESEED